MDTLNIKHHGAVNGVTGSCHELQLGDDFGLLIDCGLFQGAETSGTGAASHQLKIDFPLSHIKALVATHVHIDHVGRIPYLLAAGFRGPILCSQPSAQLLPLVLEDAVKLGFTRDPALVMRFLAQLRKQLIALPYKHWFSVLDEGGRRVRIRLQPAGHILGSAYVECDIRQQTGTAVTEQRVVFSGDLGAPHAPLLPAPRSPYRCDTLVIESTYGNRNHPSRSKRKAALKAVLERALSDNGVVLIPAFSIGRTQEIMYELESIIVAAKKSKLLMQQAGASNARNNKGQTALDWSTLTVIVDSPLASRFTKTYRTLKPFWDKEALATLKQGRDPLDFDRLLTVGSHQEHQRLLQQLQRENQPCVVIAASGMCAGGRIVNYLKALIGEARTDVVFVGYQAKGTPGRDIIEHASQGHGATSGRKAGTVHSGTFGSNVSMRTHEPYVMLDGERYVIRAGIHQLSGYSAHADQSNLLNFVKRMRQVPSEIRLIHGDDDAKHTLASEFRKIAPNAKVWIPTS